MYGTSEVDSSVQVLRIMTDLGVHFVKVSGRISAEVLRKIALMIRNHELEVKGLRTMWFGGGEGHVDMKELKKIYASEGIALTTIPDRMLELRFKDSEGNIRYLSDATEEERKNLQQPAWLAGSRKLVNRRAGFPLNPNGTLTVLPSEFDDFAKEHGIRWYGYPDYESADGMHYIATGGNQLNLIQPFVETYMIRQVQEKAAEMKKTEGELQDINENLMRDDLSDTHREELQQKRKDYTATLKAQEKELSDIREESKLAGQKVTEEDYIRSNCEEWQKDPEKVEAMYEKGMHPARSHASEELLKKTVGRQEAVQILFSDNNDECVIEKYVSPAPPEMKEKTGCAYHAVYRVRSMIDGSELASADDGAFGHEEWKEKSAELLKVAGLSNVSTLRKEISIENVLQRQELLAEQRSRVIPGNVMTPAAKEIMEKEKESNRQEDFLDMDYTEIEAGEENIRLLIPEAEPEDIDLEKKKRLQADVLLFKDTRNEVTIVVDRKDIKNGKIRIRDNAEYVIKRNGRQASVYGSEFLHAVMPKREAPVFRQERGLKHGLS